MAKNEMLAEKYALLRRQAEGRIKQWSNCASYGNGDLHQVIHELKIHLAEQEILNEELRLEMDTRHDQDEVRHVGVVQPKTDLKTKRGRNHEANESRIRIERGDRDGNQKLCHHQ